MLVVRNVRFSSRPWPLSVTHASRPGGGGAGKPSGGKSGRLRPRLRLVGQSSPSIDRQTRLIVLDEEQVVAAPLDDLGAQVTLTKHRVAEEDRTRQRQDAEQLQSRLVFVALGIDSDLRQHGRGRRRVGGDEVLAGNLAVFAATQGLAVQRDDSFFFDGGRQPGGDPTRNTRLESVDVQ
jgi:hypothetical protein